MGGLHALWNDLWPNMIAPSIWTLLGLAGHFLLSRRQSRRQHEEMKQHVTNTAGGGTGDG